jgi:hypothetical protein
MWTKSRSAKLAIVALVGCALALSAGCAYVPDRINDFQDALRISAGVGSGFGVEAKATGLVHPSIGTTGSMIRVGWDDRNVGLGVWSETEQFCPFSFFAGAMDDSRETKTERYLPLFYSRKSDWYDVREDDRYRIESYSYFFYSRPPGAAYYNQNGVGRALAFFTDVEAGAAILVVSVRVGANAFELVDFVLGLTTIDLAGDDSLFAKEPVAPEPPVKAKPAPKEPTTPEPTTKAEPTATEPATPEPSAKPAAGAKPAGSPAK